MARADRSAGRAAHRSPAAEPDTTRTSATALVDNRPQALVLQALSRHIHRGPRQLAQRRRFAGLDTATRTPGAPVQMTQVATAGGVWEDHTYRPWGPGYPPGDIGFGDKGVGAEMVLSFTPGKGAPFGDKVGLIQSVTALRGDTPDPTGLEVMPLDDQGRTIDRGKESESEVAPASPVYGVQNPEGGPAASLSDNVPKTGPNTYGKRNRMGANAPAMLWDAPSSEVKKGARKTFETTAVVLEGKHAGQYLGSVSWGYQYDGKDVALTPAVLTKLSNGNPTEDFIASATRWNADEGLKEGEGPRVQIPIPT